MFYIHLLNIENLILVFWGENTNNIIPKYTLAETKQQKRKKRNLGDYQCVERFVDMLQRGSLYRCTCWQSHKQHRKNVIDIYIYIHLTSIKKSTFFSVVFSPAPSCNIKNSFTNLTARERVLNFWSEAYFCCCCFFTFAAIMFRLWLSILSCRIFLK